MQAVAAHYRAAAASPAQLFNPLRFEPHQGVLKVGRGGAWHLCKRALALCARLCRAARQ